MLKGYSFFRDEAGEVWKIETPDLILRLSTADDISDFYKWEYNTETIRYFSICENQSVEEVWRDFVHRTEEPSSVNFTIINKSTGEKLGRAMLADLIRGWKVEIFRIYIADTSNRGRGYGKQSMLALMQLIFEEYGCERLYLDHYTGNPARKLYDSLGFHFEGILRANCRKNGVLHDVELLSMLKPEYSSLYLNGK